MDKNRYELLFMDDDDTMPTTPSETSISNKISSNASISTTQKSQPTPRKVNANMEKENKVNSLNRTDPRKGKVGATRNENNIKNRLSETGEKTLSGGLKPHNEKREQRSNSNIDTRRTFREGRNSGTGDLGNDQRQTRQFRENRGSLRNRFENGIRGGKREFDRQSGSDKTGIKSVDKRDGAGAHNWGSAKQDIEDLNKSNNETDIPFTDKEESAIEQTTDVVVPEEEESKEMTLDEWKALRQLRSKPEYNLRKAGEGEDTTQWKKMVVLNKKKGSIEEEDEFEYDPSLYPQRVGRLQRIVDIQFNFNDGRRSGGGFGRGRGRGPRTGGERNGSRAHGEGIQNSTSAKQRNILKVDDEHQFPTLS